MFGTPTNITISNFQHAYIKISLEQMPHKLGGTLFLIKYLFERFVRMLFAMFPNNPFHFRAKNSSENFT